MKHLNPAVASNKANAPELEKLRDIQISCRSMESTRNRPRRISRC